jgi:hypothetical protein
MGIEPDEDLSVVVRVVERNFDVERETCRACWKKMNYLSLEIILKQLKLKKYYLKTYIIWTMRYFQFIQGGMCGGGKIIKIASPFYLVGLRTLKLTNFTKCRFFEQRKPV